MKTLHETVSGVNSKLIEYRQYIIIQKLRNEYILWALAVEHLPERIMLQSSTFNGEMILKNIQGNIQTFGQ